MALQDVVDQADKTSTTQPPADGAAPASPTPVATEDRDPDDIELEAAHAALKQPAAPAEPKPTPPATPAATGTTEGAAPAAPADLTVPKGRLDQEIAKGSAKDVEIARLRGENDALKLVAVPRASSTAAPASTETPTPSADDQLKGVRAEIKALAAKYDGGEIGLSDYEEQKGALDDKMYSIREAKMLAQFKESMPAPAPVEDITLNERTAALETQHPYTQLIESEADWQFLHRKAIEELANEGTQIPVGTLKPSDALLVRSRIAKLADRYGPLLTGKTLAPATAASATPTAPKPGMSLTAQARASKLDAAENHPADISRIGTGGTGDDVYTEERVSSMSDDEIAALPKAIRERILTTNTG